MHTYTHTYIHTYLHTHTYIHTYTHTYIHSFCEIRGYVEPEMDQFSYTYGYSFKYQDAEDTLVLETRPSDGEEALQRSVLEKLAASHCYAQSARLEPFAGTHFLKSTLDSHFREGLH
jgi:hypothetical protein